MYKVEFYRIFRRIISYCLTVTVIWVCLLPVQLNASGFNNLVPPAKPTKHMLNAEEIILINLVNQARAYQHLAPLNADHTLSKVAEQKSQDMVNNEYFSHQSPYYGTPFEMMKQFGVSYRSAGENIACNQSVEAAHQTFMESKAHRDNILNPQFTHIGIGITNGGPCGKIVTQQFIGK